MSSDRIRATYERICAEVAPARVVVATKYVSLDEMEALVAAGVETVGENRAQDLVAAQDRHGEDLFTWDFIGALQSRKVRQVAPAVRAIHSVASGSALEQLAAYPAREVLIQVNVAGEQSKAGIAPQQLTDFIARCPSPVTGLATMPPATGRPEDSRRWFARLAELAAEHGLERLSMGTSQDFATAVQEGATIVRLGSVLYR
jgi:PLP dependent protein